MRRSWYHTRLSYRHLAEAGGETLGDLEAQTRALAALLQQWVPEDRFTSIHVSDDVVHLWIADSHAASPGQTPLVVVVHSAAMSQGETLAEIERLRNDWAKDPIGEKFPLIYTGMGHAGRAEVAIADASPRVLARLRSLAPEGVDVKSSAPVIPGSQT